jgi:hypothetical protein
MLHDWTSRHIRPTLTANDSRLPPTSATKTVPRPDTVAGVYTDLWQGIDFASNRRAVGDAHGSEATMDDLAFDPETVAPAVAKRANTAANWAKRGARGRSYA